MKVALINPHLERCGVHQYGMRMFRLLQSSQEIQFTLIAANEIRDLSEYDVILYNWHPIIDPGCSLMASLSVLSPKSRRAIFYHDGELPAVHLDAVLFSDASPVGSSNPPWHYIGRPLLPPITPEPLSSNELVIGLHGLIGAWAATMVTHVIDAYQSNVKIRMLLPPSDFCDPNATAAASSLAMARAQIPHGITLEASHEFLSEPDLLKWLSQNHANCYVRNQFPSNGISSVLDLALSARRPIVINKHPMFRHLHHCNPSICLEDSKMPDIIANGLSPLVPHYTRNDPAVVLGEVERILLAL